MTSYGTLLREFDGWVRELNNSRTGVKLDPDRKFSDSRVGARKDTVREFRACSRTGGGYNSRKTRVVQFQKSPGRRTRIP